MLKKASFGYMKRHEAKYRAAKVGRNFDIDVFKPDRSVVINRGVADGGLGFFTAKMNATWNAALEKHTGHDPVMQEWFMNGGPLPP